MDSPTVKTFISQKIILLNWDFYKIVEDISVGLSVKILGIPLHSSRGYERLQDLKNAISNLLLKFIIL